MNKQKIVILGANGFVGSHLVDRLAQLPNCELVCFDRFSHEPVYTESDNITRVQGDFFNDEDIEKALKYGGYLVHCFSSTNPSTSAQDPEADERLLERNKYVFDRAVKNGFKKIAYVSSGGAVYGESDESAPSAEDDPTTPKSSYARTKLSTESYLQRLGEISGVPTVSFRLTNPYGPGQEFKNGQGVIPLFIDRILSEEPITIFGDGTSSRDYIFIDDAVEMMSNILIANNEQPVYNIGSGTTIKLEDLVSTLSSVVGKTPVVEHKPQPATYVYSAAVSINRYIKEFGAPRLTELREGLAKTIDSQVVL